MKTRTRVLKYVVHFIWLPLKNDCVLASLFVEVVPNPPRVPRHSRVDSREPVRALVPEGDDPDLEPAPPLESGPVAGRAHDPHEGSARVALARVPRQGKVERAQLRLRYLDAAEVSEAPAALSV